MESQRTPTVPPYQNEEDDLKNKVARLEDMKITYEHFIQGNWEGVKKYYETYPAKLLRPMTLNGNNVLHLAASCSSNCQRDLKFLIDICSGSTSNMSCSLRIPNNDGNNVLHQVAVSGSVEAAEFLVNKYNDPVPDICHTDEENDTRPLLWTRNKLGETPLYRTAAFGHTKLVKFYCDKLKAESPDNLIEKQFKRSDKISILHIAVIAQHFETAYWLLKRYRNLGKKRDAEGLTSLQLLAQMPTALEPRFQESQWKMLIYHCLPDGGDVVTPNQNNDVESSTDSHHPRQSIFRNKFAVVVKAYYSLKKSLAKGLQGGIIYRIWKDKKNKKSLKKLIELLVEDDHSWFITNKDAKPKAVSVGPVNKDGDSGGEIGKEATKSGKGAKIEVYNSTPLLIATIKGIMPIVEEILKQHPQAVEHLNNDEQNILHLAILNRQTEILNLIQNKPTLKSKLNERIDRNGNTILHHAADRSYYSISLSQKLIGPAMQLQAELRWFLRVREIVPPHYTIHHNKKDQTAEEMFNYWHDQLLEDAQKWVKETAQACSTVAVLVATVVFAAAYAIPGGTNDQSGLPVFRDDPLFLLFTCMDVVAIACSLSSVAFFLSVLSSPLEYPYFVDSIPNKILTGFVLLFCSMATTMLAFAATILLLIRVEKKWTKSLLYPIAFFPVPLFGLLQFPMYQTFKVTFQKIHAWFFKPLLRFTGIPKRRSIWGTE
ncbi:hypothetical protein D8674_028092 [Pyrus ussuriensis x Pyrus communis]|uniref:PGG domain-containing protein n=1 Tax=Pyrus ussuriensis x Pyrus communis TaxID=2448454 RepID=A0A5N5ICQ3_9ROSA|nr:hypothetical protein D8674_028092 [Pyrus ussuriensis x Pyrus communis]